MDIMELSDLPCSPDLTPLTPVTLSSSESPGSSSLTAASSSSDIETNLDCASNTVTGRKSEASQRLNSASHQSTLLTAAHSFCESQKYTDLHIQCEDGTVRAHQLMLAVSSPFLKTLFHNSSSGTNNVPAGTQDQEPVLLVLPEVKISLVQALLHFLYTGKVVTQEGQFYSLMKLVYALNINASIEAESTTDSPTVFKTRINSNDEQVLCRQCSCGVKLPETNCLSSKFDIDSENNLLNSISLNKVNGNGLAVNSFTASGVVVKQEMEEKPNFLSDIVDDKGTKTDFGSVLPDASGTNQLGHFVSVTPSQGFQIKMEIPTSSGSNSQVPVNSSSDGTSNSNQSPKQSEGNPDDPLAAIMNQTIFGGDNMNTMFIQVNTNSYLSAQNSNISTINANINDKGCKDEEATVPLDDSFPSMVDDDDLNNTYNCEICNKPFKGKVMLQAHKFQEHHDNPEFEASSFPDDKYACRVCLKLFTRNSDVKAHILRVHCGDRRYPCQTCGKRFKESTHLRKHLYTHTGERPHFCSLCAKGFQTSSDLKRHKKTRIHQEKVEQAAGNTVAAITAANNAANAAAAAAAASSEVSMDYTDWTDTSTDDKDMNSNHGTFTVTAPRTNSLPFPATVSLPTVPCPPEESIRVTSVSAVSNTFTTTSTNFINQNTQPYTNDSSNPVLAEQKPSLWPAEDATISMMMSPGSLQVQNCSLPSTTLDLSDIKWGILEQEPVKREPEKQLGLQ